jgi:hypothetical protein
MSSFLEIFRFARDADKLWMAAPMALLALFSLARQNEKDQAISPFIYVQN